MQIETHVVELDQIEGHRPPETWLSSAEWMHYASLHRNHATRAWLGGRWCAKQLLLEWAREYSGELCEAELSEIHIESRNGLHQSVAPRVFYQGRLKPWRLSISHGRTICGAAMVVDQSTWLGIDVVDTKADCKQIETAWFSPQEQAWCAAGVSSALVWALKEAAYKATGDGARFQPRKVDTSTWFRCEHLLEVASSDRGPEAGMQVENNGRLYWHRYGRELLVALQLSPASKTSRHSARETLEREAILQ